MSYHPGTKLSYLEGGVEQKATVVSNGNVMCLSGRFNNQLMKLADWLILSEGTVSAFLPERFVKVITLPSFTEDRYDKH